MSAPQVDELRDAALRWLGSVSARGTDPRLMTQLGESINDILRQWRRHFMLCVPAVITNGTAYYAFSCSGGFFPVPLTHEQADAAGFQFLDVALGALLDLDADVQSDIAQLRDLQLERIATPSPAGGLLRFPEVNVTAELQGAIPENLLLRVALVSMHGPRTAFQRVNELPAGGALSRPLMLEAEDQSRGPVPVVVDLCVYKGPESSREFTSVSNTLVTLLEPAEFLSRPL